MSVLTEAQRELLVQALMKDRKERLFAYDVAEMQSFILNVYEEGWTGYNQSDGVVLEDFHTYFMDNDEHRRMAQHVAALFTEHGKTWTATPVVEAILAFAALKFPDGVEA